MSRAPSFFAMPCLHLLQGEKTAERLCILVGCCITT